MSLVLRPRPPCEPGQGGESNFIVETPTLSAPHTTGFRKESVEEPKDHSKYFSAISVGGSVFMMPVKLRVRVPSRGPPLVQSQKAICSIGKGEEALRKGVINS
ncbi:hypothetical protein NDU88_004052 [Pleurodeles waltl]|uniref:Uncharacterized protein n=1 Tax=Pleurodeles waltl TaxID=8319 RepID=A0AAV7NIE4_PLEWA|nr:hypothetical protein NDU88_004052 [Pleurodeles waltl]